MNKKLWFRAKTYGWGWFPATWQGWGILILFVLYELFLTLLIGKSLDSRAGVTSLIFLTLLAISILLVICYKFGETPHWSWGEKKNQPKRSR
jgi:hypothetical protein